MSSKSKTILILGGSYGGVAVAHYVLKHVIPSLPDKDNYRVSIISTSSHFFCRPTCPRALVSESSFPRDKLFVPLTTVFAQYPTSSITIVHGTAVKLDHTNREQELGYHALIIATGATAKSPLHGLFSDHTRTEEAWSLFQKKLPSAKSIIIAGGGPTGVETAGELAKYLNGNGSGIPITVITKGRQILPELPVSVAEKAESQLSKLGVSVIKNRAIEKVTPPNAGLADSKNPDLKSVTDSVTIALDNGESLEADLYIPATGVVPNTSFVHEQLLDNEGYVQVDSTLRVKNAGNRVYCVGHVSSSKPRAIHAIMNQTPVIGENLKRDLLAAESGTEVKENDYRVLGQDTKVSQLVVIGSKGVGLAFGWKAPSFLVWLIKGRDYWLGMTPAMWNGKQFEKAS
ncbi:FAD/NAD(P)-binding domain-containing protein [Talaromyces proteolyticus]|uniref:FAD/NAD(P)-binding domain-containing protein n=1 Tax=Talaromyces proteolyticus TaxID=1131652 RepID=A0AAD4PUI4_9EURO|nr:FAD/NAD(P)-binding domain-containing protein [Talaromyces proteolyticus]KAH8689432.1 FAD/NAD(P)-binding domain-containing protein [Talaromyces proteolyticus]